MFPEEMRIQLLKHDQFRFDLSRYETVLNIKLLILQWR